MSLAGINEKRGRQIPPMPAKTAKTALLLYLYGKYKDENECVVVSILTKGTSIIVRPYRIAFVLNFQHQICVCHLYPYWLALK